MATFIKDTEGPWPGGRVSDRLMGLRADNPSPMTYTGTNSWIVAEPGSSLCAVVDPAPEGEQVERIKRACDEAGLQIAAVVVTHDHFDHTAGVAELLQASGALHLYGRSRACLERILDEGGAGPAVDAAETPAPASASAIECHVVAEGPLRLFEGAPEIEVVLLPGHSSDSIGLILSAERTMLVGDVVFRHGPTVVFHPDGDLGDYLASLDRIESLVRSGAVERLLPAHGYPIDDPLRIIEATREHRLERLDQVKQALADGVPADPEAVYERVYVGVDPRLKDASLRSIRAQLKYLDERGFRQ